MITRINAYRVKEDGQFEWKDAFDREIRGASEIFCALSIDGKEYIVKASDAIHAIEAACKAE